MVKEIPLSVLQSVVDLTNEELQYPAHFMTELGEFEQNRPNFIEDYLRFLEICKLRRDRFPSEDVLIRHGYIDGDY